MIQAWVLDHVWLLAIVAAVVVIVLVAAVSWRRHKARSDIKRRIDAMLEDHEDRS